MTNIFLNLETSLGLWVNVLRTEPNTAAPTLTFLTLFRHVCSSPSVVFPATILHPFPHPSTPDPTPYTLYTIKFVDQTVSILNPHLSCSSHFIHLVAPREGFPVLVERTDISKEGENR